jgi:hypothetical protein
LTYSTRLVCLFAFSVSLFSRSLLSWIFNPSHWFDSILEYLHCTFFCAMFSFSFFKLLISDFSVSIALSGLRFIRN